MKIQVMHDSSGSIFGIFAPADNVRKGQIFPVDPGMAVAEIESPERLSTVRGDSEAAAAALRSVMEDFVVEAGRLVEKKTLDSA